MIRESVDFHLIPARQESIHLRLLNWARWCHGSASATTAPMFRFYRSTEQWAHDASVPVDSLDAHRIEKAIIQLPEQPRAAIRWHYTAAGDPARCARTLGVTKPELAQLVIDARNMLVNRRT